MSEFDRLEGASDRPDFSVDVPDDGYRWWYVDGVSDDGRFGVVVIAFIGSVFSPYYFRARRQGPADPFRFCSINVALYGRGHRRWCMTERTERVLSRDADRFEVGASGLEWSNDGLTIQVDERSTPMRRKVKGTIRLEPDVRCRQQFVPDSSGKHLWQPFSPLARIEVNMQSPGLHWTGSGYFDSNAGARPLEADFRRWSWSREDRNGRCAIDYAIEQRDGTPRTAAINIHRDGRIEARELPPQIQLPNGLWQVSRYANADAHPESVTDYEDTPFYTRSLLHFDDDQRRVHEFLDLDRFSSGWVQFLLPFRMPRRT